MSTGLSSIHAMHTQKGCVSGRASKPAYVIVECASQIANADVIRSASINVTIAFCVHSGRGRCLTVARAI